MSMHKIWLSWAKHRVLKSDQQLTSIQVLHQQTRGGVSLSQNTEMFRGGGDIELK